MSAEKKQNIIYIGRKRVSSYVMACMTQFKKNNAKEIILKARGRAISRCVDTAEVLRKRFMPDELELKKISTDTEKITTKDGGHTNVSSMEIILTKKKEANEADVHE